jgi:tetratricopeptide (TPR) repeat protein
VDFNFYIPANALLGVTLLGLVTGHFRFATERYWFTVRWPLKIVVTMLLLSAVGYLGAQTWKHTRECHWTVRADDNFNDVTNRLAALKKSFTAEPKNFEVAYEIGETLRLLSWEGRPGFQAMAEEAMQWFQKAIALNRYDPFSYMRYGMCLDWLGRYAEAEPYFKKALELDPNGYYVVAHYGWHYFQIADYANAKRWFERSLNLLWHDNPISRAYLEIISQKLAENAKS